MKIALYKGHSAISKLIRWQTRLPYSHAAFLLNDGTVIEAWQPCVRHVADLSVQHHPGTVVDVFRFAEPFTEAQEEQFFMLLCRDLGVPYDYRSILRFCTRKQGDGTRKKLFCSEQVFDRCGKMGRRLLEHVEAWQVAPGHIAWSPLLRFDYTVTTGELAKAGTPNGELGVHPLGCVSQPAKAGTPN